MFKLISVTTVEVLNPSFASLPCGSVVGHLPLPSMVPGSNPGTDRDILVGQSAISQVQVLNRGIMDL